MITAVPPLVLWAIPVFVLLIVLEIVDMIRDGEVAHPDRTDTATSLTMGLGYLVVDGLFWKAATLAGYLWLHEHIAVFDLGWTWPVWVLAIFADDLSYYAYHRGSHRIRLFWASHVVHHSSEQYNLSTALRQTWTPFHTFLFWLPMIVLGFHPLMIFTLQATNLLYQFWIHTERIDRLPRPIEFIMNTPSHHRVHHGSQTQYLDRNYAGILIIWDRLFGTFEPEGDRVIYGLTTNVGTYNPARVATHEYAAIWADASQPGLSLSDRCNYVVRGPGWRSPSIEPSSPATVV